MCLCVGFNFLYFFGSVVSKLVSAAASVDPQTDVRGGDSLASALVL